MKPLDIAILLADIVTFLVILCVAHQWITPYAHTHVHIYGIIAGLVFRVIGYWAIWHTPSYRVYYLHSLSRRNNELEMFIQFLFCMNWFLISHVWRWTAFFAGFHLMWFCFVLVDSIVINILNKK